MNISQDILDLPNMTYLERLYLEQLIHEAALRSANRKALGDVVCEHVPTALHARFEQNFNAIQERSDTIEALLLEMCMDVGMANLRDVQSHFTAHELELIHRAFETLPDEVAGHAIMGIVETPPDEVAASFRGVLTEYVS